MTTTAKGRTYCDACIHSYFWDSSFWDIHFDPMTLEQCVDCCYRCEDICDVDDKKCVECAKDGAVLDTLDVKKGWWRATRKSRKVYACSQNRACKGGSSTAEDSQCGRGHTGALCGACAKEYDYDLTRARCVKCATLKEMILTRIASFVILIFFVIIIIVAIRMFRRERRLTWQSPWDFLKNNAIASVKLAVDIGIMPESFQTSVGGDGGKIKHDDETESNASGGEPSGRPRLGRTPSQEEQRKRESRKRFRKSILTKVKIVIATWQIASSTQTVFLQITWPPIFGKITQVFNVLGLFIFDVGSLKCLFDWSYFTKLMFVTLAPLGAIFLCAGLYWLIMRRRGKLTTIADRRRVFANITYASLLFVYIVLPSIATRVITYFSCARFDRGEKLRDLRVIAAELSIKCTSKRYRRWAVYDAIMVALWPVGATLGLAVLLFRNRAKLNPTVVQQAVATDRNHEIDGFEREQRRHAKAMSELSKLKVRNNDQSIAGLEFLFEDYEPRCFLFPIFELCRRLFLSSVLAVFYPGSMHQLVVGLLGAMLSFVVYINHEAYIEDDDDVVAAVAEGELVLIYFAGLAVYTSEISDQKRGTFSGAAFGVLLVMVFFASFIVALYAVAIDLVGHKAIQQTYRQVSVRAFSVARGSSFTRSSSGDILPGIVRLPSIVWSAAVRRPSQTSSRSGSSRSINSTETEAKIPDSSDSPPASPTEGKNLLTTTSRDDDDEKTPDDDPRKDVSDDDDEERRTSVADDILFDSSFLESESLVSLEVDELDTSSPRRRSERDAPPLAA